MSHEKVPVTAAVRALRAAGVPFSEHFYEYVEHGGTTVAASALGVDEHAVIKTLVMETESRHPLIVLMHGDREVSTQRLARAMGVKRVAPCDPAVAHKHTGYLVGGTSPFGPRKPLPVYAESSIFALPRVYVNGGKRGFLVGVAPEVIVELLDPEMVTVGVVADAE
jgi:Cys-tRNA(Pro) deacylase